jgi:hypothetical protein
MFDKSRKKKYKYKKKISLKIFLPDVAYLEMVAFEPKNRSIFK